MNPIDKFVLSLVILQVIAFILGMLFQGSLARWGKDEN